MTNVFDLAISYSKGSEVIYKGYLWTFNPPKRGYQWSVGSIPSNESNWIVTLSTMNPPIKKMRHCSRCGQEHTDLEAIPFTRQPYLDAKHRKYHFTHFVICPVTDEPILIKLQDNPGDNDPYVTDQSVISKT